ncbi:MAG: AAA family ATPase, partial [Myxococcota bacterium]
MIEELRIDNLALVESVELTFSSGLNVLTGETGAGKSIVLSALALLTGARATSDPLRGGAESGAVEALFRMDGHEEVSRALVERGLTPEPLPGEPVEDELIVRRTLHANGRSRARIGGQLVPIAALSELFGGQLEISSQHGSQALRQPAAHAKALDAFAGKTSLRAAVARHVNCVGRLDQEIASLQALEEERARRLDFLRFQQGELAAEEIDEEGIAALEAEHRRLTHAESLAEEIGSASAALGGLEGADGGGSAEDAVTIARRSLANAVRMDASLEGLAS